ncbi:MAG: hypothetical protein H0U80_01595 [Solirubrobacterales bacterium]|nr:hypothetical protein [Solirubrobacterales bacterium]
MFEEEARPAHELEYDESEHEQPEPDEPGDRERRRPPVADWGGDDLFNQAPRRRFARTGSGTHVRRPSASPITSHQLRRNSDVASSAPLHSLEGRAGDLDDDSPVDFHAIVRPPVVTVYEPDAVARAGEARVARDRRRPRRTVDQRLGARPDRVAAWAFMLGLMLILLAVGTADASALPIP